MAWRTPKTDWKAGDIPAASDFNRIEGDTLYLKDEVDSHKAEDASTTAKGHVQLNNTVTSTSTTQAATANAVKTVNDGAKAYTDAHEQKAAPHSGHATTVLYTATLNTTWSGSSAPYSKVQTVAGILATDTPIIDIVLSGAYATDIARLNAWKHVYRAVTSANIVTFYADVKPTVELPVQIKVVR